MTKYASSTESVDADDNVWHPPDFDSLYSKATLTGLLSSIPNNVKSSKFFKYFFYYHSTFNACRVLFRSNFDARKRAVALSGKSALSWRNGYQQRSILRSGSQLGPKQRRKRTLFQLIRYGRTSRNRYCVRGATSACWFFGLHDFRQRLAVFSPDSSTEQSYARLRRHSFEWNRSEEL